MPIRRVQRQSVYMGSPCQSDVTILATVEDLINMAMGPSTGNTVNFKLLQAILHIFARQLRMLEQQVEIQIAAEPPRQAKSRPPSSRRRQANRPRSGTGSKQLQQQLKSKMRGKSASSSSADEIKTTRQAKSKAQADKAYQKTKQEAEDMLVNMDENERDKFFKDREKAMLARMNEKDRQKYLKEEEEEKTRGEKDTKIRQDTIIANMEEHEKAMFTKLNDEERVKYLKDKERKDKDKAKLSKLLEREQKINLKEKETPRKERKRSESTEKADKNKFHQMEETDNTDDEKDESHQRDKTTLETMDQKQKTEFSEKGEKRKKKDSKVFQEKSPKTDDTDEKTFEKIETKGKEKYSKQEKEKGEKSPKTDDTEKEKFEEIDKKGKFEEIDKKGKQKYSKQDDKLKNLEKKEGKAEKNLKVGESQTKMEETDEEKIPKMDKKGKGKAGQREKEMLTRIDDTETEDTETEKSPKNYLDEKEEEAMLATMDDQEIERYAKMDAKDKKKYKSGKKREELEKEAKKDERKEELLPKMNEKEKAEFAKMDGKEKENFLKERGKHAKKSKEESMLAEMDEKEKVKYAKIDEKDREKYLKEKEKRGKRKRLEKDESKGVLSDSDEESKENETDDEEAKLAKMNKKEKEKYFKEKEREEREKTMLRKMTKKEQELFEKLDGIEKEKFFNKKEREEKEKSLLAKMDEKERVKFAKLDEKGKEKYLIEKENKEAAKENNAKEPVTRVGSIEVVTVSQFNLLKAEVKELQMKASPIPLPSMPHNLKLREDIVSGSASLTDTMQAMQVSARVQAAERAIGQMAGILTALAAAGAIPEDVADQLELVMGVTPDENLGIDNFVFGGPTREGKSGPQGGAWRDSHRPIEGKAKAGGQEPAGREATAGSTSARPAGTTRTSLVSRAEFNHALRVLRDQVQNNITEIAKNTQNVAASANKSSAMTGEKLEFLFELKNRVDDINDVIESNRNQLSGVEAVVDSQLDSFGKQMHQMRHDMQEGVDTMTNFTDNSESEALQELHSRFEDLAAGLGITLHSHNELNSYQSKLKIEVTSLQECVENLLEEKADREEMLDGLQDKADNSRLIGLVKEKEFELANEKLELKLQASFAKLERYERRWMSALQDLTLSQQKKCDIFYVERLKIDTEEQLQKIQKDMIQLAKALGDPKAALLTRQLSVGALCGYCRVPALQESTDPCAHRPPALPPLRSVRPLEAKSCVTLLDLPPTPPTERPHVLRRWVGGSHTLMNEGVVRKQAAPLQQSGAPTRKFAGAGVDGRMYKLEGTLDPCSCNRVDSALNVKMDATGDSVKKTNVLLNNNKEH